MFISHHSTKAKFHRDGSLRFHWNLKKSEGFQNINHEICRSNTVQIQLPIFSSLFSNVLMPLCIFASDILSLMLYMESLKGTIETGRVHNCRIKALHIGFPSGTRASTKGQKEHTDVLSWISIKISWDYENRMWSMKSFHIRGLSCASTITDFQDTFVYWGRFRTENPQYHSPFSMTIRLYFITKSFTLLSSGTVITQRYIA